MIRGTSILNVNSAIFGVTLGPSTPQIFMSVVQQVTLKPGCSQVDVGDVESNLFKTSNLAAVTQSSILKYISC